MSQSYESFGKYILLEKLAMGGMAEIYLARSSGASGVSKFVAIKRILPQFTEQTEFIDMFKDEAKIAVNLSHANVVSIHEFGIERDTFFLAMDYIEGRNLRQILNKMKKSGVAFSIEQVLYIIKEVAGGLDHAHRCIDANTGKPLNIIHRDMSPQNVMISFEGEVKVVDFGIAKAETQLETTRAGTLKGKFGYMSPEQAEGATIDLRTDIFALGIILWELLANDRLFVANNEINTLRKIREGQIPSLRKINPNIPAELERIVSKALAKDRNLRYQTAADLHRELGRFLNRQYPDFSPQDFSVFIKTLFAGEILESRKKMVEYSKVELKQDPAPQSSAGSTMDRTIVTSTESDGDGVTENTVDTNADFLNPLHDAPKPKKKAPPPLPTSAKTGISEAPKAAPASQQQQQRPSETTVPARLQVDRNSYGDRSFSRSGVPEGSYVGSSTFAGTRSVSEQQLTRKSSASTVASMLSMLLVFGIVIGAGAYAYNNPKEITSLVKGALEKMGAEKLIDSMASSSTNKSVDIASSKPNAAPTTAKTTANQQPESKTFHNISIVSTPSGLPIKLDGVASGEVTPVTLSLAEGRTVKISIDDIPGYKGFEEVIVVTSSRTITARLKEDLKGFLNVVVRGEGHIYINKNLRSQVSPARMLEVPAGENLLVTAYDPKTGATDSVQVVVPTGTTRTLTLTPKIEIRNPSPRVPTSQKQ